VSYPKKIKNRNIKQINLKHKKREADLRNIHNLLHKSDVDKDIIQIVKNAEKYDILQDAYEIGLCASILNNLNAKNILEIGFNKGGTFYVWCNIFSKKCKKMAIDINIPRDICNNMKNMYKNISFIVGSSMDKNIIKNIKNKLNKNKLDFLFIDGNHSYKFIEGDFRNYINFVRKNGIIVLHDIKSEPSVRKFWNKIKDKYTYREIINVKGQQNPLGIGMIMA